MSFLLAGVNRKKNKTAKKKRETTSPLGIVAFFFSENDMKRKNYEVYAQQKQKEGRMLFISRNSEPKRQQSRKGQRDTPDKEEILWRILQRLFFPEWLGTG